MSCTDISTNRRQTQHKVDSLSRPRNIRSTCYTYGVAPLTSHYRAGVSAALYKFALSASSEGESDGAASEFSTRKRVQRGLVGFATPLLGAGVMGAVNALSPSSGRGHVKTWLAARRIAKEMGAGGAGVSTSADAASYNPVDERFDLPAGSSDATIAHEAGHRRIHEALGPAFSVLGGASRAGTMLSPFLSAWAASSKEPTNLPGYIQAGLSAPMLADETGATLQAMYHQTKHHGLKGALGTLPLLPALGSYASMALAPMAITKARRALEEDQD